MAVAGEAGKVLLILFLTVLLVAFLLQVPWFLALLLLIPLALSIHFWPEHSTWQSYLVAAVAGSLFTAWSFLNAVETPESPYLSFLWVPLVWGPAGVVIKRVEVLFGELRRRARS